MPAADHASQQLARLGATVRARREELSLSQEEAAYRAGYDRTYWGRIERGDANPTLLTLQAIAGALGLATAQLLSSVDHLDPA